MTKIKILCTVISSKIEGEKKRDSNQKMAINSHVIFVFVDITCEIPLMMFFSFKNITCGEDFISVYVITTYSTCLI